ncbi:endonuclease/exonuclease/phosphatase family protein [Luteipulveratus mongoliensis]|uniref:Endonuclease/exonuclease/phosphatase domain-containing protein n=1 Tax=Luteipulveratus mongoliensis TaxID=571913 RepID=A0A0K1JKI5_9MICO|nr:endonuclease/exonuclease/phosphatase family protein [Luteipulveratus mongoliensis]AKU17113.1 hypothetical protein VV02_16680 [Luteipulveratus mongoliensis]
MSWNILEGGLPQGGADHRAAITSLIAAARADVVVTVETYGLGAAIQAALGGGYHGVPITRKPPGEGDNLWIFTRLPILEVYPEPSGPILTSFNAGGVRLQGPDGDIDVFAVWLTYLEDLIQPMEAIVGKATTAPPTREDLDTLTALDAKRVEQVRLLLDDYVGVHSDPDRPAIVAGDFNTISHLDWPAELAGAPGHHGIALECPVTRAIEEAGFVDVYRAVRPDVRLDPGGSWATEQTFAAPYRIDYIFARGAVSAEAAWMLAERRPGDAAQQFCSDHAPVIAELWTAHEQDRGR